jgi:anti-anti-sigma regulatory factor
MIGLFGEGVAGCFVRPWKRVRERGGHMALCNLSENAREILRFTKLDRLWAISASRAEAMQAMRTPI